MWHGKSILITGGSGSLGSALARHILTHYEPKRLVLFSRGEHRQAAIAHDLAPLDKLSCCRFFIGDVRDRKRLELAMRDIEIVVHAAALKVVPSIEYNPFEAVATNVIGTQNVCQAAIDTGVETLCSIGSDKQVAPINTYGATKLVAERLVVSANSYAAGRTRFIAVRYGNVAGSAGSIIPAWKKARAQGKMLTLTSPSMSRFSITMTDAINTIEHAIMNAKAGQVIIPRLPSFWVEDLAKAFGCGYTVCGPRPGEKMHEVLMTAEEASVAWNDMYSYFTLDATKVRAVDENARPYASNTNGWWLGVGTLKELIDACPQS